MGAESVQVSRSSEPNVPPMGKGAHSVMLREARGCPGLGAPVFFSLKLPPVHSLLGKLRGATAPLASRAAP